MLLSVAYNHNIYTYMHTYKQKMHLWSPMSKHTQEATMSSGNSGIFLRALCFLETADIQDRLMWLSWWDCCKDGARPNFYVVLPCRKGGISFSPLPSKNRPGRQLVHFTEGLMHLIHPLKLNMNTVPDPLQLLLKYNMVGKMIHNEMVAFFSGKHFGRGPGGYCTVCFRPLTYQSATSWGIHHFFHGKRFQLFIWLLLSIFGISTETKRNETKHPNMGIRRNLISAIQTEVSIHFCCAW